MVHNEIAVAYFFSVKQTQSQTDIFINKWVNTTNLFSIKSKQ